MLLLLCKNFMKNTNFGDKVLSVYIYIDTHTHTHIYIYIYIYINNRWNLTFIGPCIANILSEYSLQDATFHNLFISVRRSTCFRRVFGPSSGAQNCTYSVRYLSDRYLTYVQFWAPDDGRKHVERLTEINKLWNVAACWLYSAKNRWNVGVTQGLT